MNPKIPALHASGAQRVAGEPGRPSPGRLFSDAGLRVVLSADGSGGSWFEHCALTRWTGDPLGRAEGWFFVLRDREERRSWSATSAPLDLGGECETTWRPGRMSFRRMEHGIESLLEACVLPREPLELRALTLVNRSRRPRTIDVTTYAEVVLLPGPAYAAHPAFARLFVQTEWVPEAEALLARRRPRSPRGRYPLLVHALAGPGTPEHATDRARFLGRGRDLGRAAALEPGAALAGTTGSVLDPIVSLRRTLELPAGGRARVVGVLGAAWSREEALARARRADAALHDDGAFEGAEAVALERLRALGLDADEAGSFGALGAALLGRDPSGRSRTSAEPRGDEAEDPVLAGLVSPARPLVVARITTPDSLARAAAVARGHRLWQEWGFDVALALVAPDPESLPPELRRAASRVIAPGALSPGALSRLEAAADLVIGDEPGADGGAGDARLEIGSPARDFRPAALDPDAERGALPVPSEPLEFDHGGGGFDVGAREYVIRLRHEAGSGHRRPPLPWVNVIANPDFGCLVSESGAGATWSRNSREHRLTPWANDPVLDPHVESLHLRDEDRGRFWSPFPGPAPHPSDYEVRHGLGYTVSRLQAEGLEHETVTFVALEAPVRLTLVRLRNPGPAARRLSLFACHALVLGPSWRAHGHPVETRATDPGSLLAWCPLAEPEYRGPAFLHLGAGRAGGAARYCGDLEAFVGSGRPEDPAALHLAGFPRTTGAGREPCLAARLELEVPPGGETTAVLLLGHAHDAPEAAALTERFSEPAAASAELDRVRSAWRDLTSTVRIETPSPEMDLVVNAWLPYQIVSCRLWGRTAFSQSGGAFGFRDQLQDAGALVALRPDLTRAQILLHAAHQFVEGDVLHWWHPPGGRGLRTRFADDRLWLPLSCAEYVNATGDGAILDEPVPFVSARALEPGEDEAYLRAVDAGARDTLHEHCCRALERSLATGVHGLPLFGTGDWNDGMNRVGREGRGESVWMGFFLHAVLGAYLPLCQRRGEAARVRRFEAHRRALAAALEREAWDGEWYLRGFYDDGATLGSQADDECRIDALVQAWSVISGVAPRGRVDRALDAVEHYLVSDEDGLIRLLTPPFRDTPHDPGYIKGYVAGVRENGGQYTHAAVWLVRAMAEAGRRDRAAQLLAALSPVRHTRSADEVERYRGEPYVVAADVYGEPPHVGRAGWTWYTGSAGWMWRVAVETVLGFTLERGEALRLAPRMPDGWPGFRLEYRVPGSPTRFEIRAIRVAPAGSRVLRARLDGGPLEVADGVARVPLSRDGGVHRVELDLG